MRLPMSLIVMSLVSRLLLLIHYVLVAAVHTCLCCVRGSALMGSLSQEVSLMGWWPLGCLLREQLLVQPSAM
jgi:hypothetical protein